MKKSTYFILMLLILSLSLSAQPDLPCGDLTLNYEQNPLAVHASKQHLYKIPAGLDVISFTLRGGAGGFAKIDCLSDLFKQGGAGATISNLSYPIGPNVDGVPSHRLEEGGTLRMIVAEEGANETRGCLGNAQGGGGGSTGIAYQPPGGGADDWYILAVAGGGGGAVLGTDQKIGKGGRAVQQGGDSRNCSGCGGGGSHGKSGIRGSGAFLNDDDGFPGGGVLSKWESFSESGSHTIFNNTTGNFISEAASYLWIKGEFYGNAGEGGHGGTGFLPSNGGAGFTGGGQALSTGGGGGGYSGGAGGATSDDPGAGGGSWYSRYFGANTPSITAGADGGGGGKGIIEILTDNVCRNTTVKLNNNQTYNLTGNDVFAASAIPQEPCTNFRLAQYQSHTATQYSCSNVGSAYELKVNFITSNGTASCYSNIIVDEDFGYTPNCQNISVEIHQLTGTATINPMDHLGNMGTDLCGNPSTNITMQYTTVGCDQVGQGTLTNTINGVDDEGNAWTCSPTITVVDNTAPAPPPNACRSTIEVALDEDGIRTFGPAVLTTRGLYDNCTGFNKDALDYSFTINGQAVTRFNCSHIGTNTIVMSVGDQSGNINSNYCSTQLTVTDHNGNATPPDIKCKNATIQLGSDGNYTIQESDVFDTALQDCFDISFMSVSPVNVSCSDLDGSPITVTVTGQNQNGHSSQCISNITVMNSGDVVQCKDATIQLDASGNYILQATDILGDATGCNSYSFVSASPAILSCSDVGASSVSVILTGQNQNGQTSQCTANVTVRNPEQAAPQAKCKNAIIFLDASGTVTLTADALDDGSHLLCDPGNASGFSYSFSPAAFSCDDATQIKDYVMTVTSPNGISSSCDGRVRIDDDFQATMDCQDITVTLDDNGQATVLPEDVATNISSNCPYDLFIGDQFTGPVKESLILDCNNLGSMFVLIELRKRTLSINNRIGSCFSTITVVDNSKPVVSCKIANIELSNNGTASVTAADVVDMATDNCGAPTISLSQTNFTAPGTYEVLVTTTDASGNSATCTAMVNVAPASKVAIHVKVMLEGPYQIAENRMHDQLRIYSPMLVPLTEPYTSHISFTHVGGGGGESVMSTVFEQTGNDAVVDWVFVELRSEADPATVLYTRSALLQRDGDIVDTDGSSALQFDQADPGNYYVCVRHRNHLGMMTKTFISLSANATMIDFTSGTTETFGTNARIDLGSGVMGMYAADIDASGTVNAADRSAAWNDRNWSGYRDSDTNLDGATNAADRSASWNNRNTNQQIAN